VGKTRLVLEAAGRLPGDPAALVGRCLPYGNGSTFWPLAEVVRQAAGIGLDDPPAAARAELAAVVGTDPDGALVAERIGQPIGLEAARPRSRRPSGRPGAARHPHRGPGRRLRPGSLEPVNLAELEPRRFRRC
jgi:hypothetical protein